jgi:hypothetical protein
MANYYDGWKKAPFPKVKQTVEMLLADKRIADKLAFCGGSVPYLLSGEDSGREHGDIDCAVKQEDMAIVREAIKEMGLHNPEFDSLQINKTDNLDYGFETFIDGFNVGFKPYAVDDEGISVRTCKPDELATWRFPKIKEDEFFTTHETSAIGPIKTQSIEYLIVMKSQHMRDERDKRDLEHAQMLPHSQELVEKLKNLPQTSVSRTPIKTIDAALQDDIKSV